MKNINFNQKKTALVIMDMQECFLNKTYDPETLLKNQEHLIEFCESKGILIYNITSGYKKIHPFFERFNFINFEKYVDSAVSNSYFCADLKDKDIEFIIMIGLFASKCIYRSSRDLWEYKICTSRDLIDNDSMDENQSIRLTGFNYLWTNLSNTFLFKDCKSIISSLS